MKARHGVCKVCGQPVSSRWLRGAWGAWLHDSMLGLGVVPAGSVHQAEPDLDSVGSISSPDSET
jgi:hypothetical protein